MSRNKSNGTEIGMSSERHLKCVLRPLDSLSG